MTPFHHKNYLSRDHIKQLKMIMFGCSHHNNQQTPPTLPAWWPCLSRFAGCTHVRRAVSNALMQIFGDTQVYTASNRTPYTNTNTHTNTKPQTHNYTNTQTVFQYLSNTVFREPCSCLSLTNANSWHHTGAVHLVHSCTLLVIVRNYKYKYTNTQIHKHTNT